MEGIYFYMIMQKSKRGQMLGHKSWYHENIYFQKNGYYVFDFLKGAEQRNHNNWILSFQRILKAL